MWDVITMYDLLYDICCFLEKEKRNEYDDGCFSYTAD